MVQASPPEPVRGVKLLLCLMLAPLAGCEIVVIVAEGETHTITITQSVKAKPNAAIVPISAP